MRIAIVVALTALASCGQQEARTYPPQYQLNFMRACLAQGEGLQSLCTCTWEKIERDISPADFAQFEQLPANEQATHPLRGQIERYALECRQQTEPAPDTPPEP